MRPAQPAVCAKEFISQSTLQMTIPEPETLSVLGIGLFASGAGLRRKNSDTLVA